MRNKRQLRPIPALLTLTVSVVVVWVFGIIWYFFTEQVPGQTFEVTAPEADILDAVVTEKVILDAVVSGMIAVSQGDIRLVSIPEYLAFESFLARAFFDDVEIPIFEYGKRIYVLVPVGVKKPLGVYSLEIRENERLVYSLSLDVVRGEFPGEVMGTAYEFVGLSPEIQDSVRKLKRPFLDALRSTSAMRRWSTGFGYPLDAIDVTGFFGRHRVYTNYTTQPHSGTDLRATIGTTIRSISEGRVLWGGDVELYFEGNAIVIDHGQKVISMYLHLDSIMVRAGDSVERDQIIGQSGASGFGTGPHLHFAIKVGEEYVDPLQFVREFQNIRSF